MKLGGEGDNVFFLFGYYVWSLFVDGGLGNLIGNRMGVGVGVGGGGGSGLMVLEGWWVWY